jgi:hypothetical protein
MHWHGSAGGQLLSLLLLLLLLHLQLQLLLHRALTSVTSARGLKAASVDEEISMSGCLDLAKDPAVRVDYIHKICVAGVQLPGVAECRKQGQGWVQSCDKSVRC